jgi:hypothetical protein
MPAEDPRPAAETRCTASIRDRSPDYLRFKRCARRAVVERDGLAYCGQHDPVEQRRRDEASRAKYDQVYAREKAEKERQKAMAAACEGVPTEQLKPGLLKALLEKNGEAAHAG